MGGAMKQFLSVFIGILLSCAILAAVAFGVARFASFLFDIVTSNEASVNNTNDEKKITVILDAGHGGRDGGAVSASGVKEKDLNLDLAKKLAEQLEAAGVSVVMTRSTDELLTFEGATSLKNGDLRARLKIAEESENSVFVSIHMNKFPESSVKGVTLYYSPTHSDGKKLAEGVMAAVKEKLQPENKRVIKEADSSLYILHRITKPAILVECGFLSNVYEASLLASEDYRSRFAEILKEAIVTYLEETG